MRIQEREDVVVNVNHSSGPKSGVVLRTTPKIAGRCCLPKDSALFEGRLSGPECYGGVNRHGHRKIDSNEQRVGGNSIFSRSNIDPWIGSSWSLKATAIGVSINVPTDRPLPDRVLVRLYAQGEDGKRTDFLLVLEAGEHDLTLDNSIEILSFDLDLMA